MPHQLLRRNWVGGAEGAAAVELALFLSFLFAMLALIAPLGLAALAKVRLERAAQASVRFAVQSADRGRPGVPNPNPTATPSPIPYERFPSTAEVCADAIARYAENEPSPSPSCSVTPSPFRTDGAYVTVTLSTTKDLGVFGWIIHAIGYTSTSINLTGSATARQE